MTRMTGLEPKAYSTEGGWVVVCTTPGGEITLEFDADRTVTVLWKPADGSEPVAGMVYVGEG